MRTRLVFSTFIAATASTVGVGALDAVPHMVGSDSLRNLTQQVLDNCSALHALGDPITYDGVATGLGESAMKVVGAGATQMIAPMTRPMSSAICGSTPGQRRGAEGIVLGLQAAAIYASPDKAGAGGIDYPGSAGDPSNDWRRVLRLIYTGMDSAAGANVFQRDCDSQVRRDLVNNWDSVFKGGAGGACADSHPSASNYDPSNKIVEPGVRHAFRLDDASGTTDVFLAQLGLSGVNYAQSAPSGASTTQAAAYRAAAGSPFCNNKRPEDKWSPTTLSANAVIGLNSSIIPELTKVGLPTSVSTGLGFATLAKGSTNAQNAGPYLNEYIDQDPIRRKCVGQGSNANAAFPMEQVCGADGTLGVVLPIALPSELPIAQRFPNLPCEPGKGFVLGPAVLRPNGDPVRCPNGDVPQDSQCLLPVRTDLSQPNHVAFDCINPPGNVPQAIVDHDGNGVSFPDAEFTDGRPDVDGRVYNLALRAPSGALLTTTRPNPQRLGNVTVPVAGAFYRIHTTRSLLLPPAHTTSVCSALDDDSEVMRCLTEATPCSIGYGTGFTISSAPKVLTKVNGVEFSVANVAGPLLGQLAYPLARKLYLNSLQGFDALHASDPNWPGDAEEELAKCFTTLPFNGTINLESPSLSLIKLPPPVGSFTSQPLCEDFDGSSPLTCGDASNTDACLGNEAFADGVIPTSFCNNGLKDGAETAVDVCPGGTSCSDTTHHCL